MNFQEIEKARKILKLPEEVTLSEIKTTYRKLSLRYHPDKAPRQKNNSRAEKFREITRARDLLLRYLNSYRYIFTEEEFKRHLGPEFKDPFDQFYMDCF